MMQKYTIEDFWVSRLPEADKTSTVSSATLNDGWSFRGAGLATFKEAPLTLSTEFGDNNDPLGSSILLVSAPGAVGKSTLAKQIACVTDSVYIDLAKAGPVGSHTITGGLANSKLLQNWENADIAILIDGLDEARLRVTQEAFQAFLLDVAQLSKDRQIPTVLLGRTGAIQDAWIIFTDYESEVAVLEIGYFGPEESIDFAESVLRKSKHDNSHAGTERKALELLLGQLRSQTESDGDRFSGYAPVLQVVAEHVKKEGNPSALVSRLNRGVWPVTFQTVVSSILEREQGKLSTLQFNDPSLIEKLYSPIEQLGRLVARVYKLPSPELPPMPLMDPVDAQKYSEVLDSWVSEHPFLDGDTGTSSSVFDAMIATKALLTSTTSNKALQKELKRGAAANPFLFTFYKNEVAKSGNMLIQPDHIGVVYASLRAGLSLSDTASLSIEESEEIKEDEASQAKVEIALVRYGEDSLRTSTFSTNRNAPIRLGAYVEDVDILEPHARVEIGSGSESETTLIAPINIQCDKLLISTGKLIVKNPSGQKAAAVHLESKETDGSSMHSAPVIYGDVSLSASWPDVCVYPWTNFATELPSHSDPQVYEALRRFRRLVIVFRAHGRGGLARFGDKIKHARMTKGTGEKVLKFMMEKNIVSFKHPLYRLDTTRLTELTDTTYQDCMACRFGTKAVAFVQEALENSEE